jgi:putative PEP-CTERM system histidine kinase
VFEFSFRGPAVISYGLGLLAFLAFSVQLGLGWRGGFRALVLLTTIVISALWAAVAVGFALTGASAFWIGQTILDASRIGGWLLFMGMLLSGRPLAGTTRLEARRNTAGRVLGGSGGPIISVRRGAWWVMASLALPAVTWFLPSSPPAGELVSAAIPSRLPYGFLLGVSVMGLVLAEQIFRRVPEDARWSIKPLCLGLGGGFVFDLCMYADALLFGRLDANIWAARGFANAMVIPFLVLATVRNREWTIDIALSRGVVFHSTAFFVSGIYLLAVAAAGYYVRYFGGSWGQTFQVGFIFTAALLMGWLFLSGTLRSKLKVLINKNFFSYRFDYREEWLRFTNLLLTRDPNISVQQRCIQALANLVESPAGMLWLNGDGVVFTQTARWNMPAIHATESVDQPLPRFLHTTGWVINLEEFVDQPLRYPDLRLPEWARNLSSAWLIVPIPGQDGLAGFMILATPRTKIQVNWEVLDLLKAAARQVGSFLGQIRTSEALLEARKFDAFNKMTAFVVHDLKNLVAQMSLLLKNAERHRHNPQFQEDMLSTIEHVAERMNKLLLQLSTGTRGEETLRPVNLSKLVKRVVDAKTHVKGHIDLETTGNVVALGYEQRFERVVGHLVQNAIDATSDRGTVTVYVFAKDDTAFVEITDTGCGMSEGFVREKLFRAFQTTKQNGMGIGAYETAQYIKEIGGSIEADSTPAAGTRIKVALPLYLDVASGDQQKSEVA